MTVSTGNTNFSIGDVVCLKGGGTQLTLGGFADDKIIVHWFANEKKVSSARFKLEQLILANTIIISAIEFHALAPNLKAKLDVCAPPARYDWSTGDVAMLRSGGPKMSVAAAHQEFVDLDWISSKGEHFEARFHPLELCRGEGAADLATWTDEELSSVKKLLHKLRLTS